MYMFITPLPTLLVLAAVVRKLDVREFDVRQHERVGRRARHVEEASDALSGHTAVLAGGGAVVEDGDGGRWVVGGRPVAVSQAPAAGAGATQRSSAAGLARRWLASWRARLADSSRSLYCKLLRAAVE